MDNFLKTGASTVTTLAAPGKALADTSITVGSTTNYPLDTDIVFAIRQVDTNGDLVAGTYTEWIGTVTSGTTLSMVATPVYGSDQVYPAGSTTQVYIPLSSYAHNRMIDALLGIINQNGTLKDTAIPANSIDNTNIKTGAAIVGTKFADNSIPTAKYQDSSVSNAKLKTGAGEPGGGWDTWTPTFSNWTIGTGGSAGTVARYKQVGKTVHFYIKSTLGTSGQSVGSNPTFTLPVTSIAYDTDYVMAWGRLKPVNNVLGTGTWATTTTCTLTRFDANNDSNTVSSTTPGTWAAGGLFVLQGFYEAA